MLSFFRRKKSSAALLREGKRTIDKSIREIERERSGLQVQEKKLIAEIKKTAKQGQMNAVKVMAKDLVRTRNQVTKLYTIKSQLQGVSLRIQLAAVPKTPVSAYAGTSKVGQAEETLAMEDGLDSDLQARLDNLRKM